MPSIKDDRGFNQGFKPSKALEIRTRRRCELMIRKMDLTKRARILEIGCGTGELSYLLAKRTGWVVLGIDKCRPFIEEASKKYSVGNLSYEIVDFNEPEPLRETGGFDYIVGDGILHHLYQEMDRTLMNIRSLLNENGRIVFLEPNILNPYCFLIFNFAMFRKLANLEPGEKAFTKRFITEKLKKAGFGAIKIEYKDFLLPNMPDLLINPIIVIGSLLEKLPIVNRLSQSIYISAQKE